MLAIASLIVMPFLARAKRRVASRLGSAAMTGDAKQTEFCAYLSAILLAGLLLNAAFGLWWTDQRRPSSWLRSSPKKGWTRCAEKPLRGVRIVSKPGCLIHFTTYGLSMAVRYVTNFAKMSVPKMPIAPANANGASGRIFHSSPPIADAGVMDRLRTR